LKNNSKLNTKNSSLFYAQLIKQNLPFEERLINLNEVAIEQLELLLKYETKKLGK
jgi:hypothetical protein